MGQYKLYTIGCPKCKVLEKKIAQAGLDCKVITDRKEIEADGFDAVPILVDPTGIAMDFAKATEFCNKHIAELEQRS